MKDQESVEAGKELSGATTESPRPVLLPCPFCESQPLVLSEYETLPPKPRDVACRNVECPIFNIAIYVNVWNIRKGA